jgi:hypothetical protein
MEQVRACAPNVLPVRGIRPMHPYAPGRTLADDGPEGRRSLRNEKVRRASCDLHA